MTAETREARTSARAAPAAVRKAGTDPARKHAERTAGLVLIALIAGAAFMLAAESPAQTRLCLWCDVDEPLLQRFYRQTGGENWVRNDNWGWGTSEPTSGWYGLTTMTETRPTNSIGGFATIRTVTEISLPGNNLSGTVPLYFGTHGGTINDRSRMVRLRKVNLSDNRLSGSLPRFRTQRLNQRPPITSKVHLSLDHLDLSGNGFSGRIPYSYVPLSLDHLNLSNNDLSGSIPPLRVLSLPTLPHDTAGQLEHVDLSHNRLSGGLFTVFHHLPDLGYVDLSHNRLSGTISFGVFRDSPDLERVDLSHNRFRGIPPIPSLQSNNPNLQYLNLSHNEFVGELDPAIRRMSSLRELNMENNGGLCAPDDTAEWREWLKTITFTGTVCGEDGADLVVESPTPSDVALAPGQSFTLSATVRNQGSEAAGETRIRYFHSTTEVGAAQVASLAAGGTSLQSIALNAPASPGTYYYNACVDSFRGERDDTNNCSTSVAVTVGADLVVLSPAASDGNLTPGQSFTLSATVRNQGSAPAGQTRLRYYRALRVRVFGAIFWWNREEVGAVEVAGLDAGVASRKSVTVNAPAEPDTYHYRACVDGVSGENNSNNCSSVVAVAVSESGQEYEVTLTDVHFERIEQYDENFVRYWVNVTARNTGRSDFAAGGVWPKLFPFFYPSGGGVSQGIFSTRPGEAWEAGEERSDSGFQYISRSVISEVEYYQIGNLTASFHPDVDLACIGCDRKFTDVPSNEDRAAGNNEPYGIRPGTTTVRAIHFRELRARIAALRARTDLPAVRWTDPVLTPGVAPVRRVHLTELRSALDALYDAAEHPRPNYTDTVVAAGATVLKAVHLMELRAAVAALEQQR